MIKTLQITHSRGGPIVEHRVFNNMMINILTTEMDELGHQFRTKEKFPYSFSQVTVWERNDFKDSPKIRGICSDRLFQQDSKKYDLLSKKHFGNVGHYFYDRSPEAIEAFLQEYCDDKTIKLQQVKDWCNVSSGYPGWTFIISSEK